MKKRVPLFIGATSPNAREVVERLKFVQEIGGDGTLLGVPYYDAQSPEYMADFYTQIAEMFPKLGFLIYHNPVNHKVKIPVSIFPQTGQVSQHHRHERQPSRHARVYPADGNHSRQDQRDDQSGADGSLLSHGIVRLLVDRRLDGSLAGAASEKSLSAPGKDQEALQVISEIMAAAGGERPGGNEGATAKLPIEFAGYVNPGPARTPIVKFSDTTIERAKKKAEGWKALCAKYRPLVEAERAQVKAAS